MTRSPGMPCAATWFRLMHVAPGKSYTACGAEFAPCWASTSAPMASSSAVVTPGRACWRISCRARATMWPISRSPARSCSDSIVIERSCSRGQHRGRVCRKLGRAATIRRLRLAGAHGKHQGYRLTVLLQPVHAVARLLYVRKRLVVGVIKLMQVLDAQARLRHGADDLAEGVHPLIRKPRNVGIRVCIGTLDGPLLQRLCGEIRIAYLERGSLVVQDIRERMVHGDEKDTAGLEKPGNGLAPV